MANIINIHMHSMSIAISQVICIIDFGNMCNTSDSGCVDRHRDHRKKLTAVWQKDNIQYTAIFYGKLWLWFIVNMPHFCVQQVSGDVTSVTLCLRSLTCIYILRESGPIVLDVFV